MVTPSSRARLATVVVLGSLAGGLAAARSPWQLAVLAGWDVSAAAFLTWVWVSVGRFTPAETSAFATREDDSRVATSILLLSASVASLVGVGLDLVKSGNAHDLGRVVLTAIAVLTVALSWGVVHTVFALRYAHEYYTEPIGGIDFKTRVEQPDYLDFAYVAFTVGMTFQVSDTDVQVRTIRRTVVRHALLSYLFGAVILAVVVNVIASVVQ
jgi:uncharacterized membrane protein